jgi:hypothetical protein
MLAGWLASMHNQLVWKNSYINHNPQRYFTTGEYLVGDLAFSNTYFVVPAYKSVPDENCNNIPAEYIGVNTPHAALCVHSEHTNGIWIWMGRFPWLCHIPFEVSSRASMLHLIKYVKVTEIYTILL